MSILYLAIFLFVSFCFYNDFKRTLILYAPFKLVLHTGILLVDSSTSIILDLPISSVALFLFFFNTQKRTVLKSHLPNVLLWGWSVYLLSMLLYSFNPKFKITILLNPLIMYFAYSYMLFIIIRTKKQMELLFKGFIAVSLVLFADAFIDVLTGHNLIIAIEESQAGTHFWHSDNAVVRAGLSRTTSFMPHSLTMGCLAALLWGVLYLIGFRSKIKINTSITLFTMFGLIFCILFSNSRSSIIAFVALLPVLFDYKSLSFNKIFLIAASFVIVFFFFGDYILWIFNSIFNEDKVDVMGSTTDLRRRQFDIASYYMMKHPFLGNGQTFNVMNHVSENVILGMESVWFPIMMQQGLVGVAGYITLIVTTAIYFFRSKQHLYLFFVVSWVATITMSSQVGLSIFLFVLVPLLACKMKKQNLLK